MTQSRNGPLDFSPLNAVEAYEPVFLQFRRMTRGSFRLLKQIVIKSLESDSEPGPAQQSFFPSPQGDSQDGALPPLRAALAPTTVSSFSTSCLSFTNTVIILYFQAK